MQWKGEARHRKLRRCVVLTLPKSTRFISTQRLKHRGDADEAGDDNAEIKKAKKTVDADVVSYDNDEVDKAVVGEGEGSFQR